VHEVAGLEWTMASTKRDFGVYFTVPLTRKVLICGATGLRVLDVTSRNCRIVEEYHAYRQWAGPPQNLPPDARFIDT
jgi:hypothetical protein